MVLLLRSVLSDHGKKEYFDRFERMVRDIENLSVSTDRASQTVSGTTVEHLEHVVKRIRGNITRIWCWLHLRVFEQTFISETFSLQNWIRVQCSF